ncbi:hypothetical protein G6011_01991 [Alternaria panax]|uniref:Uncharacterized protein n=1 Tax=Alternaria panax TaxID=48097 RepID=A0AAD4I6X0_9PLEO|nr:hypothetical protein G6011_01991 [Alternaria panax]
MEQTKKDRLAKFRQSPRSFDYLDEEDWKIFLALLDEREERETRERADRWHRAQSLQATSKRPSAPGSSNAAATDVDSDDNNKDEKEKENKNINLLPIHEDEDEDEVMADAESKPPAPGPTTIPTAPTFPPTPTVLTSPPATTLTTPTGTSIHFFHGTTALSLPSINADIQAAVQKLIQMYITRNRLASGIDACINQRYDGQSTDNADGLEYACRTCVDRKRAGENYKGYKMCIRHGQKVVGGQVLVGFFACAHKETRNG